MRPNIVLITIDSLRADRLSSLGYHREITPNIEKIAEKGCLFTQAVAVGANTRTSFPGIFASMYPFVFLKANDKGYLKIPDGVKTMTEILKEQGYTTIAFNSNPLITYYRNYDRGFDYNEGLFEKVKWRRVRKGLLFLERIISRRMALPYPTPEKVNMRTISLLRQHNKKPFFLWVHHLNVHVPYAPPKRFQKEVSGDVINCAEMLKLDRKRKDPGEVTEKDLRKLIDLYDAEIKYVDHYVGEYLKELAGIGVDFSNTFFIITSDHGDEFKEHGGFIHSAKLYDEIIRVPLIIAGPGLKRRIIEEQVSLLSLPPTILSLVSKENPPFFQGKSLFPVMASGVGGEEYVISEGCEKNPGSDMPKAIDQKISCRTLFWKYIYNYDGKEEIYSLSEDPGERLNVINEEKERAKDFRRKVLEHLEREERIVGKIKEAQKVRELVKRKKVY